MLLTAMQLFLMFDCLLVGALAYATFAHFRKHFVATPVLSGDQPQGAIQPISAEERLELLANAKVQYEDILNKSAGHLDHDLSVTSAQINKEIRSLAATIVSVELEKYQTELASVRDQALGSMGDIQKAVEEQRAAMQAQLTVEMSTQKEQMQKQIDTKLNDAVTSFLLETLQHNVDLGAQTEYLIAMLDEHKDEFKQEMSA